MRCPSTPSCHPNNTVAVPILSHLMPLPQPSWEPSCHPGVHGRARYSAGAGAFLSNKPTMPAPLPPGRDPWVNGGRFHVRGGQHRTAQGRHLRGGLPAVPPHDTRLHLLSRRPEEAPCACPWGTSWVGMRAAGGSGCFPPPAGAQVGQPVGMCGMAAWAHATLCAGRVWRGTWGWAAEHDAPQAGVAGMGAPRCWRLRLDAISP